MDSNIKILIWISLGVIYIIIYFIYKLLCNHYKKRYSCLAIVGLLIIIVQLLCYNFKYLMDYQLFFNVSINGLYPVFYMLMLKKEK